MDAFVKKRKENWKRLEELVGMLKGTSIKALTKLEVREFGELYRRASADLAIARTEIRDPKLVNYLNSLVINAHGKIYRAESNGAALFARFVTHEFPKAVRNTFGFSLLAFSAFLLCAVASYLLCFYDPNFVNLLGIDQIRASAESNHQWWLSLNESNQIGATEILTNNIRVGLYAFAMGIFFGVGTLYVVSYNGIFIGGVLGVCFQTNPAFGTELVNFMFAHGVLELTCIFIEGGAGMAIGYSLINPGELSRTQALKKTGMQAARIMLGSIIVTIIAGIIEGFISPSSLPAAVKISIGVLSGVLFFAYLILAGRSEPESEPLPEF